MSELTLQADGQTPITAGYLNGLIQTCQNFGDLRAFIGQTDMMVFAEGASTAGDGSGGLFYWVDNVTSPDDNINIVVPSGGGGGAWVRLVFSAPHGYLALSGSGNFTWLVPAGVTSVFVNNCVGGGGGGASAVSATWGGGGGGAGGTARGIISVVPGNVMAVVVGRGGAGGAPGAGGNAGSDGGNSTFGGLTGYGGHGAGNNGTGGAAGGAIGGALNMYGGWGCDAGQIALVPAGAGGASSQGGALKTTESAPAGIAAPGSGGGGHWGDIIYPGDVGQDGLVEFSW